MTGALPEQLMDPTVLVAFITSGFALVGILAGLIVPRLMRHSKDMTAIREQVQNSHKSNLRDDLDEVRDDVRAGFAQVLGLLTQHGDSINNLTTDLAFERRERLDLARVVAGQAPLT